MALVDLEFGLVAEGDVVPLPLSGADTVGDAIEIIMLLNPGDFPWMPDFGGNQSNLVFENIDPYLLARRAKDRIVFLVSQWLPFVKILGVVPKITKLDDDETVDLTVFFRYQNEQGEVDVPVA